MATKSHRTSLKILRSTTIILFILLSALPSYKFEETTSNTKNNNQSQENNNEKIVGTKIAIIGGGIAGSFSAKYLSDYDATNNAIESIVLFDPSPVLQREPPLATDHPDKRWQGGRVSSIKLNDGTVVELGGSTIHSENRLIIEMIEGDPNIKREKSSLDGCSLNGNFGIYDGDGSWLYQQSSKNGLISWLPGLMTMQLLWRYNIDLIRIWMATARARQSFNLAYDILKSHHPASFFHSIDELWDTVGLRSMARVSYDDFLDAIGLEHQVQWWRRFLPGQGCLRNELLESINLCHSHQLNSEMNGLSGLTNFMSSTGEMFSINGGNQKLISSALMQAKKQHDNNGSKDNDTPKIRHIQASITTVVSDMKHMELWSDQNNMGKFDIVILATPLQHCQIAFFITSHFDDAVLHPMPLHGMVDSDSIDENERYRWAKPLPPSATSRYTEMTTTIVSNVTVQAKHVGLPKADVPASIFLSIRGQKMEGISKISCLAERDVCKVLSPKRLSTAILESLFGPYHEIEHTKTWGGDFGGAAPAYNGGGNHAVSTPFLLYDGGLGTKGHDEGSALYYVNSIEASTASMETSAIGALLVSKLVARRIGLISSQSQEGSEEL